jgi:putative serine protease PepD
MSEQQGWAPDPADQQGRASSPAAQPTTAPADTAPAEPPGTAPVTPPGAAAATPPALPPATQPAAAPAPADPAGPTAHPITTPAGLSATPPSVAMPSVAMPSAAMPSAAMPSAVMPSAAMTSAAMPSAAMPAEPVRHEAPHAWPSNPAAAPVTSPRAGDLQGEPAGTWPAAQHAAPAAHDARPAAQHGMTAAQDFRGPVEGPAQTWPASQHPTPQAGPLHAAGQAGPFHAAGQAGPLHAAGHGGMHAAGQGGHDPRVWAATAGAGQDQPHLPTAQLPPHVPHMQRPPQWAQQHQLQPGSVFVAPPVRRRSRVGLAVAGIVAAVGLSAVSAFGGGLAALELRPEKSNTVVSAKNSSGSNPGATTTLSDVAAQVLPSVVSISTGNAVGSGVVITDDGAILTNNHVVATARGTTVQVTFSSGQSAQAKIVGTEPSSDLAVIKIVGGGTYTPLAFGDSSTVKVGDTVLAVGSPLGLDGSVTAGIVSAVNRTIDEGEDGQSAAAKITGAIQTDAAINPGNSGGALVNTAGQLVGINTAIATSGETAGNIGVGFAISSNTAKTIAQRLLS